MGSMRFSSSSMPSLADPGPERETLTFRSRYGLQGVLEELPQPFGQSGVALGYDAHGDVFVARSGGEVHDDPAGMARSPLEGVSLVDVSAGQPRGDRGGVNFAEGGTG